MITEQDIERAETALDEAQAGVLALTSAWRHIIPSRERGAALAAAHGRRVLAEQALEGLTQQRKLDQAEIDGRPDREKAAGKYIATARKGLEVSQARIAAAAEAAQTALVELLDAAQAHNALICQTAGELAAQGFTPMEGQDLQTVGIAAGNKFTARLRGSWWLQVDVAGLVPWLAHRVALARLGRVHGLTLQMLAMSRVARLDRRPDGMLAGVADPPALPMVKPLKVERAMPKSPVGIPEWKRELMERDSSNAYQVFETTKNGPPRRVS